MSSLPDMTLRRFIEALGAKAPTPGGGAAAGVTAAMAAALARMVAQYSAGKKALAVHEATIQKAIESLGDAGGAALDLAQQDAAAYARLNAAMRLPEADAARAEELPQAVLEAIEAPMAVLRLALNVLRQSQIMVRASNAMLRSDLALAAIFGEAAVHSAAWNARINLPMLVDDRQREPYEREIACALSDAGAIRTSVENACTAGW